MTSGSIINNIDEENFRRKTWSGTNGRTTENPYSMSLSLGTGTPFTQKGPYPPIYDYGLYGPVYGWDGFVRDPNLQLKAISRVAEAIRGHSFNAGIFAAELPKTTEGIVRSVRAVLTSYRALRKGDVAFAASTLAKALQGVASGYAPQRLRSTRRIPKKAYATLGSTRFFRSHPGYGRAVALSKAGKFADAWLALQYCWRPLLEDVWQLSQAIAFYRAPPQRCVFRANASFKSAGSAKMSPVNYPSLYIPWALDQRYRIKVTFRESLSVARSLGLTDPLSVAWEVMPFSFVVDWFVPVGSFLSALGTVGGISFDSVVQSNFEQTWLAKSGISTPNGYGYGGAIAVRKIAFTRTVTSTIPVPYPSRKSWEKALGCEHLANAGALITGLTIRAHS